MIVVMEVAVGMVVVAAVIVVVIAAVAVVVEMPCHVSCTVAVQLAAQCP